MQTASRISLNAVRVFVTAASNGSISGAADELNVTASAVSHQIKNLEKSLGASLFVRSNNAIELTIWGSHFYEEAALGIQVIERSIEELNRDVNELSLKVSISLAVRWLIPALEDFKQKFPLAKVRVDTFLQSKVLPDHDADLLVIYKRITDRTKVGIPVLRDLSRPVISPRLLAKCNYNGKKDISNIPALTCTFDNWDWLYWEQEMGIGYEKITYVHNFDSDDAAIRASVAGLGMVLATPLTTRIELDSGALVELPYFDPLLTGHYCIVPGRRKTKLLEQFQDWLIATLQNQE